jgi:vanillate O-demethylase ferredoxin subunit
MTMANECMMVRVAAVRHETDDVIGLDLVPVAPGETLPAFTPGAHIDVHPAPGLSRQYSLYGDCSESAVYRIGVLRAPRSRGGSAAMHGLKAGDLVRIGAPRNLFALDGDASRAILLGGGIGITPLLSMAYRLSCQGVAFEVHYYTRTRQATAFRDLIAQSRFRDAVRFHFCEEDPSALFSAARDLPAFEPGLHLYTCGPDGFMAAVTEGAQARGYPASAMHQEHFQPRAAASGNEEPAFTVVQAATGTQYAVPPDRTIAQVLVAAGLEMELSCEQGMCGTCLVDVVEGEPDHRDIYQTDAEKRSNARIAICCSRSRSTRLILDF